MFLGKIILTDFKNYQDLLVEFNPSINCITGNNGAGKTNLLDAIYYLSFTKSAINSKDNQNIKNGSGLAVIKGEFHRRDVSIMVTCALKERQKKIFKVDGQDLEKLSDHIGQFPAVFISPDDTVLIREGSEIRRKFIDGTISQLSQNYLTNLLEYNRLIKQRNNLLKDWPENKTPDLDLFESYDQRIIPLCEVIYEQRKLFLTDFLPHFIHYYRFISQDKELVDIKYDSQLSDDQFAKNYRSSLKKDLILQRTTMGIHKDDLTITMNDLPVKKYASQGQQKSVVIALKIAQFYILKEKMGLSPILLLDDVFDKLDDLRIQKLVALINQEVFGQIFITDARPERSSNFFKDYGSEATFHVIKDGTLLESLANEEK